MWTNRKLKPIRYLTDETLPLLNVNQNTGELQLREANSDMLLEHADKYTLDNLLKVPELLKPVNPTLLAPSSYDASVMAYTIAEQMQNQSENNNNN